jgi:uncharacterized protein YcgI (DUF1989 family)
MDDRRRPEEEQSVNVLPPGGAAAIRLAAAEQLRIVQEEGGQVVDTWALNASDPSEWMSMEHTRVALSRLTPRVGDDLTSSRRRAILTLTEDTSPGVHDTLMAACDPERYRLLGASGYHPSCAENYARALAELGVTAPTLPSPLNLFMNIPWAPDGALTFAPAPARAGDYVTLTAAFDTIVVLSVCPMDLNPINSGRVRSVAYEKLS